MKISELFENQTDKEIHAIIRDWRPKYKKAGYDKIPFGKYNITGEGIDHTSEKLRIYDFMLDENNELPLKFYRCKSIEVCLVSKQLKSFKNFPTIIAGHITKSRFFKDQVFKFTYDSNITTWEGFPRIISGGTLELYKCKNLSLKNIHQYVAAVYDGISVPANYAGPMLDILKIKSRIAKVQSNSGSDVEAPGNRACAIINKYLKEDNYQDRDIFSCKEELINAGLKEYAK